MKKIYSKKIFIVILLGIILSFGYVAYSATNVNLEVTPNPSENNIRLDWSMTDIQNYSFKIYQKKPGSSSFQTISAVDFNNVQEIVNVLNIYPGLGDTITFTTYDGETMSLPKSASLKMWMEQPNSLNSKGYGKGLIEVTPISMDSFNSNPSSALKDSSGNFKYDVIMIGSWDSNGSKDINDSGYNELVNFLNSGRGILFGHDTINMTNISKLKPYINIGGSSGTTFNGSAQVADGKGVASQDYKSNVVINRKGLLTNFPWQIGDIGDVLTVPSCHSNLLASGDTWLKFTHSTYTSEDNNNLGNYYLTTWNNAAQIQTGHASGAATEDEQKILANTLFYLKQLTDANFLVDNSGQDIAAPESVSVIANSNTGKQLNITLSRVDVGSEYQYYVEALSKNNSGNVTSDIVSGTITTEVKGYSYIIDENPSTDVDTTIDTTSSDLTYTLGNGSKTYLHVRAIDNAGNVGPVSHILIHTNVAPELTFSQNPTEWTNGNVVITATATDSDGEVVSITKPDSTVVSGSSTTYEVESNGTYEFVATDNSGATTTKSITVTNIDKVKPEATTSVEQPTETVRGATITINATDDASGVAKIVKPDGTEVTDATTTYVVTIPGEYSFTIYDVAGNSNVIKVPVTIVSEGVEVKYIDQVTQVEIADKVNITGNVGQNYTTTAKTVSGYELVLTPNNANGMLAIDKITVVYEYRKQSDVTAKYIDENTGSEITSSITTTYKEGDSYTTEQKNFEGYTLTRTTENTTGTVGRENIEVVYYYKKNATIVAKYLDRYTTDKVAEEVTIQGLEKNPYTTEQKTVSGYAYDSVDGSTAGEMPAGMTVITYYYIKESDVTVKYIDENTGNEIDGVDSVTTTYKEKDPYTTEKKTIEGYTYTRYTENTSGTVGRTNIEVIYYYKRNSEVTAKYIDKNTQEVIASEVNIKGLEGDPYTTSQKDIEGYVYDSVVGDASGNLKANPTEVIYYYIKQSDVTAKYIDENTGSEITSSITTTYKEGDSYTTEQKNFEGYTLTRTTENTTGTVGRENIEVVYYYKKNATIVAKYLDKYTTDKVAEEVTIQGLEKNPYTTEQKTVSGYAYDSVDGSTAGEMPAGMTVITYYYIKESDVTVKYIDENTGNEIDGVDSVTTTYKEKDPYTTEKKTIEGYTYTRDTENTSGTVGRTNIEVIYYYKRNSEVTAKYIDKNTQEVIATEVNKKGLEGDPYTTEQKTISGYVYDSVVGDASGNLKANPTEVIYYYIKQSKVITKYVDMYTDEEIAERVNITYKEGDLYSTTRKNITGYTYEKVTENASGTVAREDIEVTYYYKKNTSVAVKYIDIYTDEEIADSEKLSGVQGEPYTTIQKEIDSYKFVEVSGDTEGNMGADPKEIVYKYVKQADVYVECIDEITGVLIGRVDPVRYSEKENYTTESLSIEGYTLTRDSSNTSGVMGRENILVKYYYKKNTSVTVKYIDMVTKEEIANKEVITGLEKQDYETSKKTITGYEYIEVTGKTSGQMEREPQEVVYKYKKQSNLITEHIDANSGEKIIDDIVKTYKEGDTYEALAQNLGGYILVEEPEEKTGIMEREDIVKTFKYKKISSGLVVKYVDKMTGELLDIVTYDGNEKDVINLEEKWFKYYVVYSRPDFTQIELKVEPQEVIYYYVRSSEVPVEGIDQDTREVLYETKVTGVEGNNYTTEPRILEGYELVKVPENKEGIFGRNNLKVTYEYKKIAGKVTVRYVNRETEEEIESYEITGKVGDSYQTEAREYENLKLVEVKGNEVGTLEKEEKEVVYYYEIKTGKVVVRYEDTEGNELLKEEMSGKVGQEYKAKFKNIEGYELIEIPENEEGTYIDGTIEVVYKYQKIEVKPIEKGKIIVNFVDKDGNILLERIMEENEVGKEFYMELPEIEGYRIVGDKVIKAKFENGELVFDAVYEKIEEEIPATGDISILLIIGLLIMSIVGITSILKEKQKYNIK